MCANIGLTNDNVIRTLHYTAEGMICVPHGDDKMVKGVENVS